MLAISTLAERPEADDFEINILAYVLLMVLVFVIVAAASEACTLSARSDTVTTREQVEAKSVPVAPELSCPSGA